MPQNPAPDFRDFHKDQAQVLSILRQNRLVTAEQLSDFLSEHGFDDLVDFRGDPAIFHRRGLLTNDGTEGNGAPLFHPFRFYSMLYIFKGCRRNEAASTALDQDRLLWANEKRGVPSPNGDQVKGPIFTKDWIVDLAILLEPIYWPRIIGNLSSSLDLDDYEKLQDQYQKKVFDLVATLDVDQWKQVHEKLRHEAAKIDGNYELYLLLRLSHWDKRKNYSGSIAGALWLRHLAEVIRRAFEKVHSVQWFEEDQAYGTWPPGGRQFAFGSERPLDDEIAARPHLALRHGLLTGSILSWYVEGDTEYYAIKAILPEPSRGGIDLVNLHGNIATEKGNIALNLSDCLKRDQEHRRFSMISFDTDVTSNVRTIQQQVQQNNVLGDIAAHKPDFEFANFTVGELAEIAARIDDKNGNSGYKIRNADWSGINNGRGFEERYKDVSTIRPRSLKGEDWGRALAKYAWEHPNRSDNGSERPFCHEIRTALQARTAHYDFHKETIRFDPKTFEQVYLPEAGEAWEEGQ